MLDLWEIYFNVFESFGGIRKREKLFKIHQKDTQKFDLIVGEQSENII